MQQGGVVPTTVGLLSHRWERSEGGRLEIGVP